MTENSTQTTYSGDITLTGSEESPVAVTGPEDVFVGMNGIHENLTLDNVEYVFTHSSISGTTAVDDAATTIRGDLEDGYVPEDAVDGDLSITDAGDVFVSAHAVGDDFEVSGAENVYRETDVDVPSDPGAYDRATVGWQSTATVRAPETGIYALGAHHTIEVERTTQDIDVYVVGYGHDVTISGRDAAVTVYFLGYENTVSIGPYLSVENNETGFDNEILEEPYPVDDLIETSKREAFRRARFGRHKLTYQVPATDEEWCPNCGTAADAIIERHQMDAFFLFSYPIKVYGKSMDPAMECEHCSINAVNSDLSEQERKDVLG